MEARIAAALVLMCVLAIDGNVQVILTLLCYVMSRYIELTQSVMKKSGRNRKAHG